MENLKSQIRSNATNNATMKEDNSGKDNQGVQPMDLGASPQPSPLNNPHSNFRSRADEGPYGRF